MSYKEASEKYRSVGVDTEVAIERLSKIPVSIQCWQGDDVLGFEQSGQALSGGIQTTGNYPGRARCSEELMADFSKAIEFIPGKKRLNLHASYLITERKVDRDEILPQDYSAWVDYAKENNLGLDFNPTCFSHAMVKDNLTLSSPDEGVREFWIKHAIASRSVASYFASSLGDVSLCNLWIPDGFKEKPADRIGPRLRLKDSLDRIFGEKKEGVVDSVESKVFGIGLESFTVGSNEFYLGYAASHKNVYQLLDAGHYHPTETISEKLSALLTTFDLIPLHVSRPVRWDSDHVIRLDDELEEIGKEIIRCGESHFMIGLDFFDASINRVAAWVIGARNMQKSLLLGLLEPPALKQAQNNNDWTYVLSWSEGEKELPWAVVWDEYCEREGATRGMEWYQAVKDYERQTLSKRN